MRIVLTSILFVFCVISAIWAYKMNYETRHKKKQLIEINELSYQPKSHFVKIQI